MPSFAASKVPAVVGDTNLLRLRLCIIKPAILIPAPAKIIASNLGTRLIKKICHLSESQLNRSVGLMSTAPTNKEIQDKIIAAMSNIHSLIASSIHDLFL